MALRLIIFNFVVNGNTITRSYCVTVADVRGKLLNIPFEIN